MTDKKDDSVFPMRLNKYLAHRGVSTRRDADTLIAAGRIFVNGNRAVMGMKVEEKDEVEVRGKGAKRDYAYYAFNKPRGVITHSPQGDEADILSTLPKDLRGLGLFPIGRLDKDSHGLIILTNDGRVTDRLLNPSSEHEKEYLVKTKLPLRASFKKHMESGVDIEGYVTKPAKIRIAGEKSFSIVITEGKKHQIRRMLVAMHNEVVDLKRTRIMNVRIGALKVGEARALDGKDLNVFLSGLGLLQT
jgi:23S rRNA pseudouridine2604 synthase